MSDKLERLEEFARAFIDSQDNYEADLVKAKTQQQVADIRRNKDVHQLNWSKAAAAALHVQDAAVEAAHAAAKKANDDIDKAREDAESIADVIRGSAAAGKALTDVLKATAAAAG